ncbi:Fc.00g115530.m01.CDS01 [Cosmosporella sp. VM-42]
MTSPDVGLPHTSSSSSKIAEAPLPVRKSRKQVSRACDLCRARRIKCDNGQPCNACRHRDVQCSYKGDDEPRTLPMALRDIDKLKSRVKELEAELSRYKSSHPQGAVSSMLTPDGSSSDSLGTGIHGQISRGDSSSQISSPFAPSSVQRRPQWEGIHVATPRSDQPSYYGPASSFYFVRRIGGYLSKSLEQECTELSLQPRSVITNNRFDLGNDMSTNGDTSQGPTKPIAGSGNQALNRNQEESLLRLFWEGYHCLLPVVDEVDFRKHYASLWDPSRRHNNTRKHSALVDIILALCLQYGYAFVPRSASEGSLDDATLAGRWYFCRSQWLLTADLESPSITTVQCYIFMVAYLCCASFQNMCHILVAQAVRTAQVIGLHIEPPLYMPNGERELHKRIWWVLWTMDAKTSTKFGRPLVVDQAQATVTMPLDDLEAASYNGATLGSYETEVTWLTYTIQAQKLYLTMVDINELLFFKCGEVISENDLLCIYYDPQALEACARLLAAKLPAMRSWADKVPLGLKTRRRGGGGAYSTDRCPLDIDALAPTWLQRQSVCLELLYHTLMINLTRIFITFWSHPATYTPLTERHATICVDHAVSFTLIMHQVVTESDLLSGWSEFFSQQWNAAITIVGFILACPIHPATPRARQALDKAVATFELFGANFAVSADAASIIKDLVSKADAIAGRLSSGITSQVGPDENVLTTLPASTTSDDDLAWLDPSRQDDLGQFNQLMDWALSVDSYNSFEGFFDGSNSVDPWAFGQLQ